MNVLKYYIGLLAFLPIFILSDIYGFLHADISLNAYPILPYNVYPSYVRGTNRHCFTMERIFDMKEYSDDCGQIKTWIEHSSELDTLCVYSVLQYAWKKDTLLMEVALDNNTQQWLMASPASFKRYRCKLQKIETPSREHLSSYHQINISHNALYDFLNYFEVEVACKIYISILILYILYIISLAVLNIICIIRAIDSFKKDMAEVNVIRKSMYFSLLFLPSVIFIVLKILTFATVLV